MERDDDDDDDVETSSLATTNNNDAKMQTRKKNRGRKGGRGKEFPSRGIRERKKTKDGCIKN